MELRRVWHVYTSSDPAHLANYVASPSPMPSVHRAVSHLVYRYPDAKSGLSVWDEQLLRQTREHGPMAARVIGHTFCFDDTLDLVGDVYLFSRLIGMSGTDLVSPLISVTGDPTAMRRCEVKLTPFGEQVLAGEANHVKVSGIDDWIGGVHLSRERPVTFRDGDTLVLPG